MQGRANVDEPGARPGPAEHETTGVRVEATGLTRRVRGRTLLDGVSLSVEPGEVVAIVGGSGAGKTTLLQALSAVVPADDGRVAFDGADLRANLSALRSLIGYVPQEDIIHTDLPLRTTLRYAARLRLPPHVGRAGIDSTVDETLRRLNLDERADVTVGALSGGQRKRASIAVELLTRPRVFFLDEPTSGLDPATAAGLLRVIGELAGAGATVLFTTHAVADLARCDKIVFLGRGGRLAFVGSIQEALAHFRVPSVEAIYERLDASDMPAWTTPPPRAPRDGSARAPTPQRQAGWLRQWRVLTRRTFETLVRSPLTLAILLGSPVMVVAMFAILFQRGVFAPEHPSPSSIVMIVFWVAFAAFFFGLTYGLLQVTTERAILQREHFVGLRLGPYLFSKLAVLLPFLVIVDVLMLAVLRGLDRLPAAPLGTYLTVGTTIALEAAAALSLGLLTSAAVRTPSQATLALPLLCFPAVLFSGAILPVHLMAGLGAAISVVMPVRWTFEAIGHDFAVRKLLSAGGSPLGPPLIASYGDAGNLSTGMYWLILGAFTLALFLGSWLTLRATCRRRGR